MDKILDDYIKGLKNKYFDLNAKEEWSFFEKIKEGASEDLIKEIKWLFRNVPSSFINLLKYVDGTYYRKYNNNLLTFYFLGSDINKYPYYLLSSLEIMQNFKSGYKNFHDYVRRKYDKNQVLIDDKITNNPINIKWLHFSDCMNNGGTSKLFIDFSPSKKGKSGQIIRFLHDPDQLMVIADSFDDYLLMIISNNFDFIDEDSIF